MLNFILFSFHKKLDMKKIVTALAILLSSYQISKAQTKEMPWQLGLGIGISEYFGDMGNGFFKFDLTSHTLPSNGGKNNQNTPGVGFLTVNKYLNKDFDLSLRGYAGEWGYFKDVNPGNSFYRTTMGLDFTPRWKFLAMEKARFVPYLTAGVGVRRVSMPFENNQFGTAKIGDMIDTYDKSTIYEFTVPLGLGLNVSITEKIGLNLQSNYMWTNNDFSESGPDKNASFSFDQAWFHSIGITYNVGKMKDADGDGVSDKRDNCPNTQAGALVDEKGCILDKDKDGIADNLDACPDKAGIVAFKGCPDTDKDGIEDAKDKCPETAGIAKFEGCPDTDNDGIQDKEDKCPTVAGIAKFNGCPDTDGDGIQDSEDACPNAKGTAQFNGCPDTDGDGLIDKNDKCPTVAGPSSNNGCPEIKAEVRQLFERALQGVQFETGKSAIKKESFAILTNVVRVMTENPSYKLYIAGHTDNVGNAEKNLQLSKDRAAAVEKFLESKGIATERVRSEGFGQTAPVADNATKEGKAKNRRVEFKVEFEDVVK